MTATHASPQQTPQPQAARKAQPAATQAASASPAARQILQLQRQVGNAATQRLLGIQREVKLDEVEAQVDSGSGQNAPASSGGSPPAQPGGDQRMTRDEFLNQVTGSTVIFTNPMIGFSLGDTFAGFPATVSPQEMSFNSTGE